MGRPHQPFFFTESYAEWSFVWCKKSGQIFLPFYHNPRVWQTDRRTESSSLDRLCIPCSAVKPSKWTKRTFWTLSGAWKSRPPWSRNPHGTSPLGRSSHTDSDIPEITSAHPQRIPKSDNDEELGKKREYANFSQQRTSFPFRTAYVTVHEWKGAMRWKWVMQPEIAVLSDLEMWWLGHSELGGINYANYS